VRAAGQQAREAAGVTLRAMMNRHARAILGNVEGGFAEIVTYRFKNEDPDREIAVIVKRLDLEPATPTTPQVTKLRANVEIPRHATLGVLTIEKGDAIVLAMRIGGTAEECRIRRIVSQDDALFVVQVEQ
jgi:hypothetical protein